MAKKRIVVLYGGKADEHPISCISTAGVLKAMDTERFEPIPVGITKSGQWIVNGEDPRGWDLSGDALPEVKVTPQSRPVLLDVSRGCDGFLVGGDTVESLGHIDAVLPVLHGPYGEDGTIQGLLEMMNVPYVGCGVLASAACMDKHYTKVLLNAAGIATAPASRWMRVPLTPRTGSPPTPRPSWPRSRPPACATRCSSSRRVHGSSFGVTKVEREGDAAETGRRRVRGLPHHDWRVLIEQGIDAREIECAVLCAKPGDEPKASWPGEIVLDRREDGGDQFYDFDSKYMDSSASHVEVPANLPEETLQRVRETAIKAFKAVDGMGLSRVDSFVTADGAIMINEINTMPGFTPISMYPKAWEATGLSYTDLITTLIEGVLR